MAKDFKVIRKSIDRLKELGLPECTVLELEVWLAEELVKDKIANCEHTWMDVTNKYVSGTAWCPKCGALAALSDITIA